MTYRGDISLGDTFDFQFNTVRFSTGAPFTLAGTPTLAAYVGNSTTEITAGLTLTVDFDAKTGLHNVRVVATSGNGYAAGTDVTIVLAAGTVDSVSVANMIVGSFSIEKRSGLLAANAITASVLATDAVNEIADGVRARQLTEGYAADGVAPTLEQAIFLVMQMLTEMSISGTTMTIKKLDGTTTAATLILNDATTPTSVTRAT